MKLYIEGGNGYFDHMQERLLGHTVPNLPFVSTDDESLFNIIDNIVKTMMNDDSINPSQTDHGWILTPQEVTALLEILNQVCEDVEVSVIDPGHESWTDFLKECGLTVCERVYENIH